MERWKTYRLNQLTSKITKGTTPSNIGEDFTDEGIMYFRSELIGKSKYVDKSSGLLFISKETNEKLKRSQITENDMLFSMAGIYLGKISLVGPDDYPANTNQAVAIIRFNSNEIDLNYIYYYMTQEWYNVYINSLTAQAAQPNINLEQIGNLEVQLPSLATQHRIASILSAYDNLIENNNKRIKILEQMAENLYKEWFVRFRFPGHETTPFENGIPKGWKIERLGNVANISTGKSNRQDADEDGIYPFFDRSQEIKRSNIWLKDCEAIIVPGEGTIFYPRYYQGKFDLHQRCYCVEPKVKEIGKFLFYVLNMNRYYFLSVATGATVPSLRQNNFLSMKYLMPSIDLCKKFNQIVSKLFDQKDHLKEENQNLIKQRDLLLPRLMSGKLAV
ncbi:MAG: restriction endonuclease subunit S [Fibrobacter sp.]|nr:restriction endonuclease subunit S [Fibrobacter sp.]MDY6369048.1 restriction endonuclease subunit S [Fibrobacter sp.]MDY6389202.1 restriction endonuclease subunit S [Fibrobacter sp.]